MKKVKKREKKVKKKILKKMQKREKKLKKKILKRIHSRRKTRGRKFFHEERVSTGIVNYDRLIDGGFEKNSTNLIVGGSGIGKSIIATEFLITGVKKGERCLYVTFEETKEQFYHNMRDFGWDLEDYEKKGLFYFLEYAPAKVRTMLEEGGGEIERIILGKKISRVVIDSITSFALLFKDELSKRQAALSLFNMIKGWQCTSLLTLEEESTAADASKGTPKTLEFEVDSLTFLYFVRKKFRSKRERYVEVIKMRGTKHAREIYQFHIKEHGIVVEKKSASTALFK